MDIHHAVNKREQVEEFLRTHRIGLLTLFFCDIVDSTKLKQTLGDIPAVTLILRHHTLVRETLRRFSEAREISTAGDSFFLVFTKPSDAVRFALLLQSGLAGFSREVGIRISDRMGVHVGEVLIAEHSTGRDLYGMQIDLCARITSLAQPDQILLTRSVFDSARQVLRGQDLSEIGPLSWLNHGPYEFKGIEEPIEVCEVGEVDRAPLKPPTDSSKARRPLSVTEETVLGWRPAVDQPVPNTRWVLERNLGQGGFGEVWLGRHERLKERRVFKFCFLADRVRALKRELTLFRVLKERIGHHPNVVGIQEVNLEQAPFYLMMDYGGGVDLRAWCESQGGAKNVALGDKLEIIAQVADGLQAAHDAGVIHRDVKPSNILIRDPCSVPGVSSPASVEGIRVHAQLTDFGIGQVVSEEVLAGLTKIGFTQTMLGSSTQAGTQMYMAPELLAGKPASTRSDIYALGAVLYQLLCNDLTRPVTVDWRKEVADPLLQEDLEKCFAGSPQDRFGSAAELAGTLRRLGERNQRRAEDEAKVRMVQQAAYRMGVLRTAIVAAVVILLFTISAIFAWKQRQMAKQEAARAQGLLLRSFVPVGNMSIRDGDPAGALPWFVEAVRASQSTGQLEELHRSRIGTLLRQFPELDFETLFWDEEKPGSAPNAEDGALRSEYLLEISSDCRWIAAAQRSFANRSRNRLTIVDLANPGDRSRSLEAEVIGLAFSPNNQQVAVAAIRPDFDETVEIRALVSWQLLRRIKTSIWRSGFGMRFTSDGSGLLWSSGMGGPSLWNLTSGQVTPRFRGNASLGLLSYAPRQDNSFSSSFAGDYFLARIEEQTNEYGVWDLANDRQAGKFRLPGSPQKLFLSLDGRRALSFMGNGLSLLFTDCDTGRAIGETNLAFVAPHRAWMSRDGKTVCVAGQNGGAFLWAPDQQRLLELPELRDSPTVDVVFSPTGKRVACLTRRGTVVVNDVGSGRFVASTIRRLGQELIEGAGPRARALDQDSKTFTFAFTPDDRFLVVVIPRGASVWDLSPRELPELLHAGAVKSILLSADQSRIITLAEKEQTPRVWDVVTGRQLPYAIDSPWPVGSICKNPDARTFLTVAAQATVAAAWLDRRHFLRTTAYGVWDDESGKQVMPFLFTKKWTDLNSVPSIAELNLFHFKRHNPYQGAQIFAALSPSAKYAVAAFQDKSLSLYTTNSSVPLWRPIAQKFEAVSASFSEAEDLVAISFHDDSVQVYKVRSGEQVHRVSLRPRIPETANSFKDAPSARSNRYQTHTEVQLSLDGKYIVTLRPGGERSAIYRLPEQEPIMWWTNALSFNRSHLPSDTEPPLGDQAAFQARGDREEDGLKIGHRLGIWQLAYNARRGLVASVSEDCTARVWDAATGEAVTPPLRHSGPVLLAELSRDGNRLFTGSKDGVVNIWNLQPDRRPLPELEDVAKLLSGRAFDKHEGLMTLPIGSLAAVLDARTAAFPRKFKPVASREGSPAGPGFGVPGEK